MEQVVAELVAGAAPDGPYARTLLLVTGDHGQTLGGDHGGGSPEEVDSALVAVDIAALRALQGTPGGGGAAAEHAIHHAALAGSGSGLANPAACRAGCTCGVEGNQCVPDLPQMDLVPTLAAMAGVPTPFGNLGKLNAEMWQLAAPRLAAEAGQARSGQQAVWEASLLEALMGNARQVGAAGTASRTPYSAWEAPAVTFIACRCVPSHHCWLATVALDCDPGCLRGGGVVMSLLCLLASWPTGAHIPQHLRRNPRHTLLSVGAERAERAVCCPVSSPCRQ